jgi:hypothetical protein
LANSSPSEPEGSQGPETGEIQLGVEENDELVMMAQAYDMETVMPLTILFERAYTDISRIWI